MGHYTDKDDVATYPESFIHDEVKLFAAPDIEYIVNADETINALIMITSSKIVDDIPWSSAQQSNNSYQKSLSDLIF